MLFFGNMTGFASAHGCKILQLRKPLPTKDLLPSPGKPDEAGWAIVVRALLLRAVHDGRFSTRLEHGFQQTNGSDQSGRIRMHAVELASLTSTLVQCSRGLISLGAAPHRDTVQAYWLANRFRHDSWAGRLAAHRQAIQGNGISYRNQLWHEIMPVIQEVLLSEPLARYFAYYAAVLEEQDRDHEFAALAQSTLAAHIEARHRCLHLMVFGQGLSVEDAVRLNRMRRALETYTDQLLSALCPVASLSDYCFDAAGVSNGQVELAAGNADTSQLKLHTTTVADSLWQALQADIDWRAPNARQNHKLSQIALQLLPPEFFDSCGVPKSSQRLAIEQSSLESTGKCNDLSSPLAHPLNVLYAKPRSIPTPTKLDPRW